MSDNSEVYYENPEKSILKGYKILFDNNQRRVVLISVVYYDNNQRREVPLRSIPTTTVLPIGGETYTAFGSDKREPNDNPDVITVRYIDCAVLLWRYFELIIDVNGAAYHCMYPQ
jgi:hypothetical protein